ncbi:hypothetical protein OH492_13335 [Vibrio chagasii]|nr:hypothetical protein [Vibrio chagasii]
MRAVNLQKGLISLAKQGHHHFLSHSLFFMSVLEYYNPESTYHAVPCSAAIINKVAAKIASISIFSKMKPTYCKPILRR